MKVLARWLERRDRCGICARRIQHGFAVHVGGFWFCDRHSTARHYARLMSEKGRA